MNRSKYLIPSLLIILVLAVLASAIFHTFQVGNLKQLTETTSKAQPTPSAYSYAEEAAEYPGQAHITDGILVFGIIIVGILLFDIAWGGRTSQQRMPKPGRK